MKAYCAKLAASVALAASTALAGAQPIEAYTTTLVDLRAGPGEAYPVVTVLPSGMAVLVQGCLADYSWCDLIAGERRGWVWAGHISHLYQNVPQPVLRIGAQVGIVVLVFVLDDYWDLYYRDRAWYPHRSRWARPVPPPPVPPAPPPMHPRRPQPAAPLNVPSPPPGLPQVQPASPPQTLK